jgi:cytochrome b
MAREAAMVRVWDLPTRLFHWALAFGVVAAIVSARLGGAAMTWHMRFGYGVFTLLAFRLVWGFVGGHWSRFRSFVTGPTTTLRYLRGESGAHEHHDVGHTPLGAWSVLALLVILAAQVATGLVADDEIASNGPLFKYVGDATSAAASHWHRLYGQWLIIFLALLHVGAVAFWSLRRGKNLVGPMLHGDKALGTGVPAAHDTLATRMFALALVAGCAIAVALIARLGD